jgi:hypothetical protein
VATFSVCIEALAVSFLALTFATVTPERFVAFESLLLLQLNLYLAGNLKVLFIVLAAITLTLRGTLPSARKAFAVHL